MSKPVTTRKNYIPTLDGWRAISICAVMFYHIPAVSVGPYSLRPLQEPGRLGVNVFFIISGFLISSRLLQEERETGQISLKSFYLRRLFRIQPAALIYLFALVLLAALRFIPFRTGAWLTALLACRNYYPYSLWDTPGAPYTSHFWSLAVEEHFYLILPLSLYALRSPRRRIVGLGVLCAVSFIWARIAMQHHVQGSHTDVSFELLMTPTFVSVALFQYERIKRMLTGRWLVLLSGAIILLMTLSFLRFHGAGTGPLLFFLLMILVFGTALHPHFCLSRLLELAPLRYVGRISYSLYLWQELFCITPKLSGARGFMVALQDVRISWICAAAAAMCSYYFVEKPFIRLGHSITRPKEKPNPKPL